MGRRWERIFCLAITLMAFLGCTTNEARLLNLAPETSSRETLDQLPPGTFLEDLDLGGIQLQEAQEKVRSWSKDKLEENLYLVYNETEILLTPVELGITLDFEKTWEEIQRNTGQRSTSILTLDYLKANQTLQEKLSDLTRSAVDATFKIENDQFKITPASSGEAIDVDAILNELKEASVTTLPHRIPLTRVELPAATTTEALEALAFNGVIGEYTTQYNVQDKNRSANLLEAAKKMDKTVLKPGDTFSFNDTIGPRTAETGFKDAYIVINNEYVKGIGGGICQVSSTLYNAALLANLSIVERHPHAVVVAYIPIGQDATVNYPNLDLKLLNDTQSYVYLRTKAEAGKLTIKIYGKKTGAKVRFEKEIEKELNYHTVRRIDPDLLPGAVVQQQNGSKGFIMKTWKIVTDAKGKETKQLLSRDTYAPTHRILKIGAD
ncbi:putative vancomycin resistance protein [Desulfitobacterium dichloroeliminans LMG P-21439]|uniref:Putative vancomycin resistance protein n=1 Tax=Desulfitobacterium dichloroeliminans (strain LMG P-21439 / DCA1) TaxID=871963 RepID=L0F7T9_DESDL|nr:VanW family protein [Desulfitobacterium dichloroeliminans]AGA69904.1 putative vancomycin resistance protein [Desulfitobacterium dichloroeliminans LMG P-21439]